jgi:hypothetical protein
MRRWLWPLLLSLALAACSRKEPTPTLPPTSIVPDAVTPSLTPTPAGTPIPRITIVPSATRLPRPSATSGANAEEASATPPATPVATATTTPASPSAPAPTPTEETINAGPTETAAPTATLPESPLVNSPLPSPTASMTPPSESAEATPVPGTATFTPRPTEAEATATTGQETTETSTATPTPTPTPEGEAWLVERVAKYYDSEFQEFYVLGEVRNNTQTPQRITALIPVVYNESEEPITTGDDVDFPAGYNELLEQISLDPGQSLAFNFVVFMSTDIPVEDNFDVLVESASAEASRDDLDIPSDDLDTSDWPDYLYVRGTYRNPGADLTDAVTLVATIYDEAERVIGVGWQTSVAPSDLTNGDHEFEIVVEVPFIVDYEELAYRTYKIQVFGY